MSSDIYLNGITYPSDRVVAFPGKDGKEVFFKLPEAPEKVLNGISTNPPETRAVFEADEEIRQMLTSPFDIGAAVADMDALYAIQNPAQNETHYVISESCRYSWTGSAWTQTSMKESKYADELRLASGMAEYAAKKVGLELDLTWQVSWTQGMRINANHGNIGSATGYAASNYVPIEGYDKIQIMMVKSVSAVVSGLAFYSNTSEESFVAGVPQNNDPTASEATAELRTLDIPQGAKYFRTTWYGTSHELYPRYTFSVTGIMDPEMTIDTSLTKEGAAAEAKAVGDAIDQVTDKIGGERNLSALFAFTDGKRVNYNNGLLNNSDTAAASDFVPIDDYDILRITTMRGTVSTSSGLAFYGDADVNSYISGIRNRWDASQAEATAETRDITIPDGAKYVRTSWFATTNPSYSRHSFACIGIKNPTIKTEDVPAYYFEDGYLDERIKTILDGMEDSGLHGDSFFWFTDPHPWHQYAGDPTIYTENSMQSVPLIRFIQARTNIRKIFCGGDVTNGTRLSAILAAKMLRDFRAYADPIWQDMYCLIGNHEYNNPGADAVQDSEMLPVSQIYSLLIKDKEDRYGAVSSCGDYWVDNPAQSIRYFCLGASYKARLTADQIHWFGAELSKVPSGYTVVVLSHIGLTSDESGQASGYVSSFEHIAGLMDASKAGEPYQFDGVTYDFANAGFAVACAITGHIHRDLSMLTAGGIPVISTICDRGPIKTSTAEFIEARNPGTVLEQAIDVVQIDTGARTVRLTRIGGAFNGVSVPESFDRAFSY